MSIESSAEQTKIAEFLVASSIEETIAWVCAQRAISANELLGHNRSQRNYAARLLLYHALWGFRQRLSMTQIAARLGRDHTTLSYALRGRTRAEARERVLSGALGLLTSAPAPTIRACPACPRPTSYHLPRQST